MGRWGWGGPAGGRGCNCTAPTCSHPRATHPLPAAHSPYMGPLHPPTLLLRTGTALSLAPKCSQNASRPLLLRALPRAPTTPTGCLHPSSLPLKGRGQTSPLSHASFLDSTAPSHLPSAHIHPPLLPAVSRSLSCKLYRILYSIQSLVSLFRVAQTGLAPGTPVCTCPLHG